jgi:hypothetical protein
MDCPFRIVPNRKQSGPGTSRSSPRQHAGGASDSLGSPSRHDCALLLETTGGQVRKRCVCVCIPTTFPCNNISLPRAAIASCGRKRNATGCDSPWSPTSGRPAAAHPLLMNLNLLHCRGHRGRPRIGRESGAVRRACITRFPFALKLVRDEGIGAGTVLLSTRQPDFCPGFFLYVCACFFSELEC